MAVSLARVGMKINSELFTRTNLGKKTWIVKVLSPKT
jgi:hypothetical protein